ncbi:hypothetical protein EP56_01765 [Listeriaceae bacterium FSL A5-0209]|nr:hypothetical protein EP56_01765 [Listeriaceae bacterium FSL A5-0209]
MSALFKKWLIGLLIANFGWVLLFVFVLTMFGAFFGAKEQMDQSVEATSGCAVIGGEDFSEAGLQKYLETKGVFRGHAADFFTSAEKHQVDVTLFVAIAMQETGNGTSKMVKERNNPGGLMGNGGGFYFDSLPEGMDAMAKNLFKNYISMGLTTPELIQPKYAPSGASNDPGQLNNHWVKNVNLFLKQLGGQSSCAGGQGTGKYILPVDNPVITSPFSDRINPVTGQHERHKGLDFGMPAGTPIKATDDGIVVFSGMGVSGSGYGGYGNVVHLEHSQNKEWTLYAHMQRTAVKNGDVVKKGQVIGYVGSTGQSTGNHLHYEIRKQKMGGQIDPAPVLGLKTP